MTARRDTDRLIATWLTEIAPEGHVDYLDTTLEALDAIGQRPAWASPARWLRGRLTSHRVAHPRVAPILVVVALLLVVTLVAVAIVGSRPKLPAPFGLAATGLVAFESGGDIVATMPDGSGRRTLIADEGFQWGQVWSHRGDRFVYWSAPSVGDPAALWMADGDGSNQHRVVDMLVPNVADLIPQVSWSPDDGRLVFAVGAPEGSLVPSQLYVVNADGTDLHPIGEFTHQRDGPIWSPEGSWIAYTGQPLADPYEQTSTWVITPDGLTDVEVIPAKGGWEIANVDPTWSLDGRSILVHTGGASETDADTDISVGHQDAAGEWSAKKLVLGGLDYLPSFSTSGSRITFLRFVDGSDPTDYHQSEYGLMVADADGLNVREVSPTHVAFATPCWSPDDRFIRVVGLGEGADRTIRLFPLDGSPPVDIPAPGAETSAGCQMQRLAP